MIKRKNFFIISIFLLISFPLVGMVTDNRFFPWLPYQFLAVDGRPSHIAGELFFTTASQAFGENEEDIGIPELYGFFDQGKLANAFVQAGMPNPLPTEYQGSKIPWKMNGKLSSQGFGIYMRKTFRERVSIGLNTIFMRANSSINFSFKKNETNLILGPGGEEALDELRREMFEDLGLKGPHSTQVGPGDIEGYVRVGGHLEYPSKFRSIRAGGTFGILFPTGERKSINAPAAVPFGGNGHWGFYVQADAEFEVKEDMKAGFLLRLTKRFENIRKRRMPALTEPQIFGVLTGDAAVEPGITFLFNPYVVLEDLRGGLGIRVRYALTAHQEDDWEDKRSDKTFKSKLFDLQELTKWGSDYFMLKIFYDFGKVKVDRGLSPIVSFSWDIPAMLFVSQNVARTHKVALGLEFNF